MLIAFCQLCWLDTHVFTDSNPNVSYYIQFDKGHMNKIVYLFILAFLCGSLFLMACGVASTTYEVGKGTMWSLHPSTGLLLETV